MTRSSDADERAPLLGPDHRSGGHDANGHHDSANALQAQTAESHTLPPTTLPIAPARRLGIIFLLFSLSMTLAITGVLATTATMQALEDIICRQVHGPGFPLPGRDKPSGDDDPCKDDVVLGKLTILLGWDGLFTLLPGLLLSVPYGAAADRYGRVPIFGLVILGVTLKAGWVALVCFVDGVLDLRMIWLGNLLGILGGGPMVFSSMVYTILGDISTDAQRSTAFFYSGTILMVGSLAAQPITYFAMQRGKWFAFGLAMVLLIGSVVVAFCVPETLDKTAARKADPVAPVEVEPNVTSAPKKTEPGSLLIRLRTAAVHTMRVMRWMFWEQKLVGFLMLSLTCEILGRGVMGAIQQQYISKRYHLTFAEANLVDTISIVTIMALLTAILPFLSYLLTRYGWSARAKDLRLAQGSALLTATGCLLMGMVHTLPLLFVSIFVFSLGMGYTYMIRGLMTSLVGAKDIALLYTSIAFVETAALLVATPMFSYLFKVGMGWGGGWIGLPYLVGGAILVGAAALVGGVRGAYVDVEEETDAPGSNPASGETVESE